MKTHARVVVIGGGIVGCSVLYHLAKLGWTDVMLCERKQLTAGSSWHAAGGFHALNSDPGIARLQAYTIQLYREVEKLSGQDIGLHFTGGINVAATPERWDFLRADVARHAVLGLETRLIGADEIRALCPLMDTSKVLGALYDPKEGHLDPSGATYAFAKAALKLGATIQRNTRVLEIASTGRGTWEVVTESGTIEAEHVVNAAGLWAREVGQMVGADLPVVAMEHHYLLTEDLPELHSLDHEIPLVLDLDGEIYLRQERKGVLLGVYEKNATPWAPDGAPWDYGENELLAPDLDRLTDSLDKGFTRFPALREAGIRRIVNGPFTFTPDGNPIVGPVPGLTNYWAACGVMAGFAQGGGVGLALSQWMVNGEPEGDIYAMDVARYGPYASRTYAIARTREFYSRRFQIAYPNEHWPAARPAKTSPLHPALAASGGVFGVSYGTETPLYFAGPGEPAVETPTLRRSNAFARVAEECAVARTGVAVLDVSAFAKYLITGAGARAALGRLLAGQLPPPGRISLTPMLSHSGKLMGDLTTMCLNEDRFLVTGSGYLQSWHMRWFAAHLPQARLQLHNISDEYAGVAIIGPRSRELLSRLTALSLRNAEFPFLSVRCGDVGLAPAIVARMSVSGELGYEIYAQAPFLAPLLNQILMAGIDMQVRHIGMYALNSLRLEKSFGIWSREFSRDYTPAMSGLHRFIAYDRAGFIGHDAATRERGSVPKRLLRTLLVDSREADAAGYEPIRQGKEVVGFVTSGGYGHYCQASLAMGYINADVPPTAGDLTISVLGKGCPSRILPEAMVDPKGLRMRG